nr:probable rhamnogalacturonate lyase B isoform X2 [Ipomoea batatas]
MASVKQSRTVAGWFVIAFHLLLLLDYSSAAAPQGPPATPKGPSTAPQGPSAAPQGPSAAPQGPSGAPQGPSGAPGACKPVKVEVTEEYVGMDNGIVSVNFSKSTGSIIGIKYQGIENLLSTTNKITDRGYWDIDWNRPNVKASSSFKILATNFTVISQAENQAEVSFTKVFKTGDEADIPVNFDKRFIMLPGVSGFYTYAIYDHPKGAPDVDIDQTRIVFKLSTTSFKYLAVSDEIQGEMPSYAEREAGQILDYKEAVLLKETENPKLKGKVDDKYTFALESQDMGVYGWISPKPHVGFWVITASNEFRLGGPIKQDLTCHCGPFALSMFLSAHYAGENWGIRLRNEETKSWPYSFIKSDDYPIKRGTVSGRLLIHDVAVSKTDTPAKSAHVGLAAPGAAGSWQFDAKSYQFWTRTDDTGNFKIGAIRPGTYSLYAWAPGHLGDFIHKANLTIKPGDDIKVGDLVFTPPRNGTTLWEIGTPDRRAAEFFIPDPTPELQNSLISNGTEKWRQYGLWNRYTDLYPKTDLVYNVGKSDPAKNWFYAHVNRKTGNNTYAATVWTVTFPLEAVDAKGSYTLRIAVASATRGVLMIWVNSDTEKKKPNFTARLEGRDNAVARHGIHGLYEEVRFGIPGSVLVKGENTLKLRQAKGEYVFNGLMYDYLRLEAPAAAPPQKI